MGTYINPGNEGFRSITRDEYVDKTGLIALVNEVLDTPRKLVCVTRPRRFGKTFAAEAVSAYYSCGCDSRDIFDGLALSKTPDYLDHLNRYNVVRLDMTAFMHVADTPEAVSQALIEELRSMEPGVGQSHIGQVDELQATFLDFVRKTGQKFVFVIDEWDAPLRENVSSDTKRNWVFFLRQLFKNSSFTPEAIAGAYMTGILPIQHYGTQSALSDFREFTMLDPADYAPFVGLTEDEVCRLAKAHHLCLDDLRAWYDGYALQDVSHIYAPFSVMEACIRGKVGPYWISSEAFESLRLYIDMDFDGLQTALVQLLGGGVVRVDTSTFNNDMHEVHNRNDLLTLLIHLGYLSYDYETSTVHVPNEEIRSELRRALEDSRHVEVARIVRTSDELLEATWNKDSARVAETIGRVHTSYTAPLYYNNEQALRAVVKAAYISARDHYARIEELPSGRGYADIAFIPRPGSDAPAMLVELKWNEPVDAAISQIMRQEYPQALEPWSQQLLLVGISYDPQSKEHSCRIEACGGPADRR